MEIKLVVVEGAASRGEVQLQLPAVIGRSKDANLTIGHPKVSRRHCELYEEAGRLMIRDHGSLNGTLLDGNRVSTSAVPAGGKLTIGPLTFIALYDSPSAKNEPSVPVITAGEEGEEPSATLPDMTPGPDTDAAGFDLTTDLLPPAATTPSLAAETLTGPAATVAWRQSERETRDEPSDKKTPEDAMNVEDDDLTAFLRDLGR